MFSLIITVSCSSLEIQFLRFFETEIDVNKKEDVTLDKYSGLFLGTSSDSTIILGKLLLSKETELKASLISFARIDNIDNPVWESFESDTNGYFKIKNLSYGTYKLLIFHLNYKQKVFQKIVLNNRTPKIVINTSLDPIK